MKYLFETYGCQMNIAESAALSLAAKERGWEETLNPNEADFVLLNTCSVRETAEQRVLGRLAHYSALKKKSSHKFVLALAGCMAERIGEKLKKDFPNLDYVMGTHAREELSGVLKAVEQAANKEETVFREILKREVIKGDEKPVFSFSPFHHDAERSPFRAFVPITHGCDNFCSYCIVPYVRGREISRDSAAIIEEINLLLKMGVKDITLLGQNVNSYRYGEVDFPSLLSLIAKNAGKTSKNEGFWVRFLSSHPKDFSNEAIRIIAENPVFCRHIHLCVQHGSNGILKAMNRRYTREQYLDLVSRLRAAMPDLSLSTDILVGFPGETEEDLEETLALMEEVRFLYAYMYHYNPREGTAAFSLPGRILPEVKKERLSRVIALQKRHTKELLDARLGKEVVALIEGISRKNADELIGRTERDEMVVVGSKDATLGSFAKVTLSSLRGNTFRSRI